MHVDLSHTPGLLYALAYWLSSTFYIQLYGSPFSKGKKFGISAGFLALIASFMTLTDGVSAIGFFPCMGVTVALIFFYIRIATHMPWANAGYYCARAFILGEFSASLAWYLFYFFVTVPGLPLTVWTTILVFAAVHAIILYTMFLLERKYSAVRASLPFLREQDVPEWLPVRRFRQLPAHPESVLLRWAFRMLPAKNLQLDV